MVAPQLVILAVILPLESSRILGSVAIDAAGRGTLLRALALRPTLFRGRFDCLRERTDLCFLSLFRGWGRSLSIHPNAHTSRSPGYWQPVGTTMNDRFRNKPGQNQ